jgi:hypothetical protein
MGFKGFRVKPENWIDLPADDDLRKIYAECKRDKKDIHQELKKRGLILDLDSLGQER